MKRLSSGVVRVGLYLVLIAPLLLFIAYAFSTRWFFPEPFPIEWTTTTFQRALNDSKTFSSVTQGLWIAVLVSIFSLIIGFPAARVLGLREFRGRQVAWLLLFLPTVIPPLAIGMGMNVLFFNEEGLCKDFDNFVLDLIRIVPLKGCLSISIRGVGDFVE